ncbi:hypothetical protein FS842_010649 [Serendipita sp. 407]|nr:hypothetical protein FS842_010649 [Serendipita sp. 407]
MAGLWTSYMETAGPKRPTLFSSIIDAAPTSFSQQDRKGLVQNILDDISDGTISKQDLSRALLAVKTLARHPDGSAVVVKQSNLKLLCKLAGPSNPSTVTNEALRCVANALLLVESGRDTWIEVGGGQMCLQRLQDPKTTEEFCFLHARILFLVTLKQCPFLKSTVEDGKTVEAIAERCETLIEANVMGRPFAKDALTDVLKFIFNLMLQYPRMLEGEGGERKVMGEQWSLEFEPLVEPLVHMFVRLPLASPPLSAPLTHVIHALLNIPVPQYSSIWFPSTSPSGKQEGKSSKNKKPARTDGSSTPTTSSNGSKDNGSTKDGKSTASSLSDPFQRAMSLLSSQRKSSSRTDVPRRSTSSASASGSPPRSTEGSDAASSSRGRSSSPAGSKSNNSSFTMSTFQMVTQACSLLENMLAKYWPGVVEADAASVRTAATKENLGLDEALPPLVVLMARMAEDAEAKTEMRKWILPDDLDRSGSLEERPDTLGRCIRLMTSVYFPRLKDAIGEWLYVLCDSDGALLSAQIGYGNAAGYLFNKGILSAPPPPASGSGGASLPDNINPITGAINRVSEDTGPEMTEEEKEREAERLFVLFDRLEKTGMAQNPVRKAIQEGKLNLGPFGT